MLLYDYYITTHGVGVFGVLGAKHAQSLMSLIQMRIKTE